MNTGATARQSLVVFSLDEQRYAIPLEQVRNALRMVAVTPVPEGPALLMGLIDLAGNVIPVIDTRARFQHPDREIRLSDQLLVVTTGRRTVALWVDNTWGVLEVTEEHFVPAAQIVPGLDSLAGALKLPDGLILIHDLDRLLSLDDERSIEGIVSEARGVP